MSDARHRDVSIEELHAFVDGQLPAGRIPAVEAHLAANPEAAARVRDYRLLNAALRTAFAQDAPGGVAEPRSRPPARRRPLRWVAVAAAFAGLVLGGAGGWMSRGYLTHDAVGMQELARHAATAYTVFAPDDTHPVDMAATESDRLAAWLSRRMDMRFPIPELGQAGFALVGGRLMVGDGRPAGMLMYENGQKRRIVLYVRNKLPDGEPSTMRHERSGDGATVYWRDTSAGFALAGEFSEQELTSIANMIRASFAS
jgi:anti-sigma factor RsiW